MDDCVIVRSSLLEGKLEFNFLVIFVFCTWQYRRTFPKYNKFVFSISNNFGFCFCRWEPWDRLRFIGFFRRKTPEIIYKTEMGIVSSKTTEKVKKYFCIKKSLTYGKLFHQRNHKKYRYHLTRSLFKEYKLFHLWIIHTLKHNLFRNVIYILKLNEPY